MSRNGCNLDGVLHAGSLRAGHSLIYIHHFKFFSPYLLLPRGGKGGCHAIFLHLWSMSDTTFSDAINYSAYLILMTVYHAMHLLIHFKIELYVPKVQFPNALQCQICPTVSNHF